jgi:hypothetical protein
VLAHLRHGRGRGPHRTNSSATWRPIRLRQAASISCRRTSRTSSRTPVPRWDLIRLPRLRHGRRPVLARVPLRLRVLRHRRACTAGTPRVKSARPGRARARRARSMRAGATPSSSSMTTSSATARRAKALLRATHRVATTDEGVPSPLHDRGLAEPRGRSRTPRPDGTAQGSSACSSASRRRCRRASAECGKQREHRPGSRRRRPARSRTAGIEVMAGFIVGFDHDRPDVFARQRQVHPAESGIATAMVGLLTALPRRRGSSPDSSARGPNPARTTTGNNLDGALNFQPQSRSARRCWRATASLVAELYAPRQYYRRVSTYLRRYRRRGPRMRHTPSDIRALVRSIWVLGFRSRGRRAYWSFFIRSLFCGPHKFGQAMYLAVLGYHFRIVAASIGAVAGASKTGGD